MKAGKAFIVIISLLLLVLASASAKSISGEGYGNTLNDAKANALADLLTNIAINVSSTTETRYSSAGYENYLQGTTLSTDYTLMFVRYDVSESSTKAEKASGKYKCIAQISDEDKMQCVFRASELVSEIQTINGVLTLEKDLRSRKAYLDALAKRFSEYDACMLTATLLGYSNLMPTTDPSISSEWVAIESKKTEEAILKAGLSGTMSDTTMEGLEAMLLDRLWNKSDTSSSTDLYTTTTSEGHYSKIYKVGDFGPAGGIIFYDKGVFSDGWRFLEVASEDINGSFDWGKKGKLDTSTDLGAGKINTQLIIGLNSSSGSYAALACANYQGGGYSDWYLPSKEELELIYKNLRNNKNLNMLKAAYWSSSQMSNSYAYGFSFKKKKSITSSVTTKYRVRPVRAF